MQLSLRRLIGGAAALPWASSAISWRRRLNWVGATVVAPRATWRRDAQGKPERASGTAWVAPAAKCPRRSDGLCL